MPGRGQAHAPTLYEDYLLHQAHVRWEATEPRLKHLYAMLIDEGSRGFEQAFLHVLLYEGRAAGDGIANIAGLDVVEVHLCSQEADHAADVGNHAGGEQAGDDAPPEKAALREGVIDVIGIIVSGDAAEDADITLGKGAPEGEGLPGLYRVESFAQLLLKFGCGF